VRLDLGDVNLTCFSHIQGVPAAHEPKHPSVGLPDPWP
jgi:hypothetical protein